MTWCRLLPSRELGWPSCGARAAKATPELEVLALGGGKRRFEPCELGAVVALELGELGGERAHDVALRGWRLDVGLARSGRRALLVSAELLDASAERRAV